MSMSEFEEFNTEEPEDFNPLSLEEQLNLLPPRCRNCDFASFAIGMTMAFAPSTGGPMPGIKDIQEHCTGYEGDGPELEIETVDTPDESYLLFPMPSGEDKCPYSRYLDSLNRGF